MNISLSTSHAALAEGKNTLETTQRLQDLRQRAADLLPKAPNGCGVILHVLSELTDAEIIEYANDHRLTERTLERLADALGYPVSMIQEAVRSGIGLGLRDDRPNYRALLKEYRSRPDKGKLHEMRNQFSPPKQGYVLYRCVAIWCPKSGVLSDVIDDNDERARLSIGWLASKGRAFQDAVEVLETSTNEEWAGWQQLWRYY